MSSYLTLLRITQTLTIPPVKKHVNKSSMNAGIVKVIIYFCFGNALTKISQTPRALPARKAIRKQRMTAGIVRVIISTSKYIINN